MNQDICFTFDINGFEVKASYSYEFVEEVIKPLLMKWNQQTRLHHKRMIIYLAAPPAAGKSTLATAFETMAKDMDIPLQAVGMDGFHHYQQYIESHTVDVNGIEVPMKSVKGCPESFDYDRFKEFIIRTKEEDCWWPKYDRSLHDVVDDQIYVDRPIVLIEGNYLLLDEKPWNELKEYCDESIFIETDEDKVKTRLITRKMQGGSRPHEAISFYENSDGVNVRRILNHRLESDITLEYNGHEYLLKD